MASTSLPCRYRSSRHPQRHRTGRPGRRGRRRTASGWITVRPSDCTASVTRPGRRRSMSRRTAAAFSSWNGAYRSRWSTSPSGNWSMSGAVLVCTRRCPVSTTVAVAASCSSSVAVRPMPLTACGVITLTSIQRPQPRGHLRHDRGAALPVSGRDGPGLLVEVPATGTKGSLIRQRPRPVPARR